MLRPISERDSQLQRLRSAAEEVEALAVELWVHGLSQRQVKWQQLGAPANETGAHGNYTYCDSSSNVIEYVNHKKKNYTLWGAGASLFVFDPKLPDAIYEVIDAILSVVEYIDKS